MHIYFSGIGGVALGPLAEIALDAKHSVSGSDLQHNSMTALLEKRGVTITLDQSGAALEALHAQRPIDWFVHTAALPADHPELIFAHTHGIRTSKRDELLKEIIAQQGLELIAVSGTHGKTTTTGMLIWLFQQLGLPVSYSLGTTISFGPSGKIDSESRYFVYECDEFDRNFLHFQPSISLVTSLDYDHPDTYPTKQSYFTAFSDFLAQSTTSYSWQRDIGKLSRVSDTTVVLSDQTDLSSLVLPGLHNRQNGWLALAVMQKITDASLETLITLLNAFPGTHRRFEKLADNLYSDYGHHPVEIAATLQMAREMSKHVALVYQPHQNVRQHEIKDDYDDCMNDAEMIYWLPTYLSREDPKLPILTPAELSQRITVSERVALSNLDDELWNHIAAERKAGNLVLCMGAGSIDAWVRQRLAAEPANSRLLAPR